ncbi:hypothetical protein [Deinococcus sonorensis]|uniref:Uncharacterized protein n=2 Tax=Deinococcus sonorensis TaxID=309891 RepID=A0AAU7U6D2_9DEIO
MSPVLGTERAERFVPPRPARGTTVELPHPRDVPVRAEQDGARRFLLSQHRSQREFRFVDHAAGLRGLLL